MKQLLTLLFITTITFTGFAEKLSNKEKIVFDEKLQTLKSSYLQGELGILYDTAPPRFFTYMAEKANTDVETIKKLLKKRANLLMEQVEIKDYIYHLDDVEVYLSPTKRRYAFIPYENIFKQAEKEITVKGVLLMVEENDKWYMITWQDKMANVVYALYPDLKGIQPPQ